ncbi:MAG: hypothetical protein HXX11_00220 [Desulfuromonadales bacterium]|nr:hypothetical protein [Desulfuromonadales bacterium]
MSSTNFKTPNTEKEKILECCSKIHQDGKCSEIMSTPSEETDSYYCNKSDMQLFESEVYDYDFNTPVELRTMLQNMWHYQGHEYMKEFAVIATIAAFHNKAETAVQAKTGIPAFIYNF